MKFTNSLAKGLKIGAQVLASGVAFGVLSTAAQWHPPSVGSAAADAVISLAWNAVGIGATNSIGGFLARWSTYDARRDPRTLPPA